MENEVVAPTPTNVGSTPPTIAPPAEVQTVKSDTTATRPKLEGYEFYRKVLGSPQYVVGATKPKYIFEYICVYTQAYI